LKLSAKSNTPKQLLAVSGIREINRLRKIHGSGNWRKRKGSAMVRLHDGSIWEAEVHWYEAAGIDKREFKIERYRDITS